MWIVGDSHVKHVDHFLMWYKKRYPERGPHPAEGILGTHYRTLWFGQSGGMTTSIRKLLEVKIDEDTNLPQWVLVHVGVNDISEPTGCDSCREFAEILGDKIIRLLTVVHNKLTQKCVHYKGVIFSQIMPVIRYPSFAQKDQWWAEDTRQIVNKMVYNHAERHYNEILTVSHKWFCSADWAMYAKFKNPSDEVHLSLPGYLCFLKKLSYYLQIVCEDMAEDGLLEGYEIPKTLGPAKLEK